MENLKIYLENIVKKYNEKWFIMQDPISIPHKFSKKEDIEIAGFMTATISWGQRAAILKKANLLTELMDESPYDFLINASSKKFSRFNSYVYRTFNNEDCQYFISALREIYLNYGGLEDVFTKGYEIDKSIYTTLVHFRSVFMSFEPLKRTEKHLANVIKGSAAKRLNMFLRWMVRDDGVVDFGLWKNISKSDLMIPLDVHVGRVARSLGLLERKQNDWKAVVELTSKLKELSPDDPVKYDYALFGLGVCNEKIDF